MSVHDPHSSAPRVNIVKWESTWISFGNAGFLRENSLLESSF